MSEWWKYTISDFLLFSPRTYYRMIERYNEAVWPGHLLALALGVIIIWPLRRQAPWQGRAISTILAVLWAWVGWGFIWQRYANINWAATYLAWLFGIEVVLLIWTGAGVTFQVRADAARIAGITLIALGMALYPVLAPMVGRDWRQAEVFGIAPDPTVVGTLGLLLLAEGPRRFWLLAAPLLWCVVSGATLWAMGAPEAWAMITATVLGAGVAFRPLFVAIQA
jgi:hypothetical protein